jgi:hypothetical protein
LDPENTRSKPRNTLKKSSVADPNFYTPDPRSKKHQHRKEFKNLIQTLLLSSQIRDVDPGSDQVSRGQKNIGSRIRNTGKPFESHFLQVHLGGYFLQRTLEKSSCGGEREYFSKNVRD